MCINIILICFFIIFSMMFPTGVGAKEESKLINFQSADGILISADIYMPYEASTVPMIILFHQAGSSRGEYIDIAPVLNKLGFNCIAVDLRSGEFSRGKDNLTAIRASNAGLPTSYADALPDILAALRFANKHYGSNKIIAWGSSYSASLVLKVAGDHPELIDAVLAFSPGEYFSHIGKSKAWIRESAKNVYIPVFITSSKNEVASWKPIYEVIPSKEKTAYVPDMQGRHGSRALWSKYNDSSEYWNSVTRFLSMDRNTQKK